jgi:membrane carboxypeptidase/penicillin-binding protein
MNIKKFSKKKIILMIIALILTIIIGYYAVIVTIARLNTIEIISSALASDKIKCSISDFTSEQLNILLTVEDPNFYNHSGVDFSTPGAGITTITQGLVKILYFEKFSPGIAKLRQSLIAYFALDPLVSKQDQLTLFINHIYLSEVNNEPIYGFYDAALKYYGKKISELSTDEFISIVAMIIAPTTFSIRNSPDANKNRVEHIKLLISGEYKPKGLMDLYYGGGYYTTEPRSFIDELIWGY